MEISEIQKNRWQKGEEWFEKWYSTEQCFLGFHFNPLTKSFITQGLDSLATNTQWFYEINVCKKWDEDQIKAADLGSEFFQKLISDSESYIFQAETTLKRIENISQIDFKSFILIKKTLMGLWYVFLADIGKYLGERIDKILSKKNLSKKQVEEIKNYYLVPHKPLAYQKEEKDLRKIKDITSDLLPKTIIKLLKKHQEKYSFLTTSDIDTKPASINDYQEELKELTPYNNFSNILPKISKKTKSFLNKDNLLLLSLINKHLYIDNYASDLYERIDFLFQELLSKSHRILFKELGWYTFSELESLVRKNAKLSNPDLSQRKQFRVMAQINGKIGVFYGKKNFNKIMKILNLEKTKPVKSFKGTTASLGCVRGIAKIVKGVKDIDKVKNGDIIVANNTRPDLMPAIRRCVAIVANYGGVTSHAAIVSRELKIPCMVGTHIATDVLKDGDLVEVDANKGIVKIINQEN
ncbi:MAG: hypothetical protein HYT07_00455 [Candidatus Levybacteria bacterium]|nr:hypothetical protein [Candidatus Levybacteria bacterium]